MIEKLARLVDDVGALQSKLVLLMGPPHLGKTALLKTLATIRGVTPLNVGAELGGRLAGMPQRQPLGYLMSNSPTLEIRSEGSSNQVVGLRSID